MDIGYFNDFAFFNCLFHFSRLGLISGLSRHQRHQGPAKFRMRQSLVTQGYHGIDARRAKRWDLNRLRVAVELAQSSQYRSRILRSEQAVDEVKN